MKLRNVAVVGFAQGQIVERDEHHTGTEMLYPVVRQVLASCNVQRDAIDYQVGGSSDYIDGRPFAFTAALDVLGSWPPKQDSHLDMDAAWAAHYAWIRIQAGECDTALIYGFGKASEGSMAHVLNLQLDPFYQAPMGLDPVSTAALQASAYMARTGVTDRDLAEVAARNRAAGAKNPNAQLRSAVTADELQRTPWAVHPLRQGYLAPQGETASCLILAAEEKAEQFCRRPVWIHGVDHRSELQTLGARDLTRSASAKLAAEKALAMAGLDTATKVDVVELGSATPVEELVLRDALGLKANGGGPVVNPSGGVLCGNPLMSTGLIRLGEAFAQLSGQAGAHAISGAQRALAQAAAGHCLQQHIVWVLGTQKRWT